MPTSMTSWNGIPLIQNTTESAIDTIYGPIVTTWIAGGGVSGANVATLESLVASGPVVALRYHTAYTNVLEDALVAFEGSVADTFSNLQSELALKANLSDIPEGGLITITGSDSILVTGNASTGFQLDLASGATSGATEVVDSRVSNLVDVLNRTLRSAADRIKYLENFVSFIQASSLMTSLGAHPDWTATINQIGWPPVPGNPAIDQTVDLESGFNPFATGNLTLAIEWNVGGAEFGNPPSTTYTILVDPEGPRASDETNTVRFRITLSGELESADAVDSLSIATEDGDMLLNGQGTFTYFAGSRQYIWSGSTTALETAQTYTITLLTNAGITFIAAPVTIQASVAQQVSIPDITRLGLADGIYAITQAQSLIEDAGLVYNFAGYKDITLADGISGPNVNATQNGEDLVVTLKVDSTLTIITGDTMSLNLVANDGMSFATINEQLVFTVVDTTHISFLFGNSLIPGDYTANITDSYVRSVNVNGSAPVISDVVPAVGTLVASGSTVDVYSFND